MHFVQHQQLVDHVEQDVRFSRIAWPAYHHLENISRHAGVALLVAGCGRKVGIVIWNFHFPYKW